MVAGTYRSCGGQHTSRRHPRPPGNTIRLAVSELSFLKYHVHTSPLHFTTSPPFPNVPPSSFRLHSLGRGLFFLGNDVPRDSSGARVDAAAPDGRVPLDGCRVDSRRDTEHPPRAAAAAKPLASAHPSRHSVDGFRKRRRRLGRTD